MLIKQCTADPFNQHCTQHDELGFDADGEVMGIIGKIGADTKADTYSYSWDGMVNK